MTMFVNVKKFKYLGLSLGPLIPKNPLKNGFPQDKFFGSFQIIVNYDPMNTKWPMNKFYSNLQVECYN